MKPRPTSTLRVAALFAVPILALTGCGGAQGGADPVADESTAAAGTGGTPSASPSAAATLPAGASLRQRLLPAAALPAAGGRPWQRSGAATGPVGACNDLGMEALGASKVLGRAYTRGADRAANVVARVPDAMTAHRAVQVLEVARDDCEARPGALHDVQVEGGTGWWYRTGGDAGAAGFGVAVVGTRFSLVTLEGIGPAGLATAMPELLGAAAARIR